MTFSDLVGIPFRRRGRDAKTGLDCWGLFRLAMSRFGLEIPEFDVDSLDTQRIDALRRREIESARWIELSAPEPGCAVAMSLDRRMPDMIQHVGVCIDGRRVLHTMRATGSVITRLEDMGRVIKVRGFYRWADR